MRWAVWLPMGPCLAQQRIRTIRVPCSIKWAVSVVVRRLWVALPSRWIPSRPDVADFSKTLGRLPPS